MNTCSFVPTALCEDLYSGSVCSILITDVSVSSPVTMSVFLLGVLASGLSEVPVRNEDSWVPLKLTKSQPLEVGYDLCTPKMRIISLDRELSSGRNHA